MTRNERLLQTMGLLAVTAVAIALMVLVSTRRGSIDVLPPETDTTDTSNQAKAAVAVLEVKPEETEILDRYSGMIRPWERYSLAFEVAGRVESLGVNQAGEPLDDGDHVRKNQVLARLDDRIYRARESETAARLEQATSDLRRAKEVEKQKIGAISDADVQQRVTAVAVAKAEHEVAVKNLADTVLVAPVDATISRRLINVGEAAAPHVAAFELVEVDRVLLVLGVPESNIPEIQTRMAEVRRNRALPNKRLVSDEDRQFKVYVDLIDRNRSGQLQDRLVGTVYRISETADDRTGLFDVEVLLPNAQGVLRPGMIARADLVTKRVQGFRIPATSVLFGSGSDAARKTDKTIAYVFSFAEESSPARPVSLHADETRIGRAHRVNLVRWVEQGDDVVVLEAARPLQKLIWRGQHRLMDGQLVKVVPFELPGRGKTISDRAQALPAAQTQRR